MAATTAASLVALVQVQGANALVTAMNQSQAAMTRVANAARRAGQAIAGSLNSPLARLAGLLSAGAIARGLYDIGKFSIESALNIERLSLSFEALTGSADIAQKKMNYLKEFAKSSVSDFKDLAEAGMELETLGYNMERVLPTVSRVAGAFGGTKEQILALVQAFNRLEGGQAAQSMRVFRRFGINEKDLAAEGIGLGGGRKAVVNAEQMFEAIERIANRKFGNIGRTLSQSVGVALKNVRDGWELMLSEVGAGFLPIVNKVARAASSFMDFLRGSKVAEAIGQNFASGLQQLTGITNGGGLTRLFALITATVEELPRIALAAKEFISGVANSIILDGIVAIVQAFQKGYVWIHNETGAFVHGMKMFGNEIMVMFDSVANSIDQLKLAMSYLPGSGVDRDEVKADIAGRNKWAAIRNRNANTPYSGLTYGDKKDPNTIHPFTRDDLTKKFADALKGIDNNALGGIGQDISKMADSLVQRYESYVAKGGVPDASQFDILNGRDATAHLANIAANTMKVAENTNPLAELKRIVLGGGPLAQAVATPSQIRAAGGPIQVRVTGTGRQTLDKLMSDIMSEMQIQMARGRSQFGAVREGR